MSDFEHRSLATWREFIGDNEDYYLRQWGAVTSESRRFGVHWAAFLFGPGWLLYRRMLRPALVWSVGALVVELVLFFGIRAAAGGAFEFTDASLWKGVDVSVGLITNGIIAVKANAWYLDHARARLLSIAADGASTAAKTRRVSEAGGVSWTLVIAVGMALGAGQFVIERYLLHLPA